LHTAKPPKKHLFHMSKAQVSRSHAGNAFTFLFVFALGLFIALPLVYAVGNSLKPLNELWIFPPNLLPRRPTFRNFSELFILLQNSWVPMPRYLFNTIFITAVGTFGQVILSSLCAYPLAKHPFPGAKIIFRMVFFSLMFSSAVTSVPNYLVTVKIGWIDTYRAVIIPAMGNALGLYLMKQFMEQIHDSFLESAKIDGASEWRIFWGIVMPMVKPAWLTLIVFSVQSFWNMGANIMIYSEKLKTFPYAVSQIVAGGIARAGVATAVMVVMMAVPMAVFVVTQRSIIQTMASSGVKE